MWGDTRANVLALLCAIELRLSIRAAVLTSLVTLIAPWAHAVQINSVWQGGTDNWSNAAAWSVGLPQNGANTYIATIDNDGGVNSIVSVDLDVFVDAIEIQTGDSVTLLSTQLLDLSSGPSTMDGTLTMEAESIFSIGGTYNQTGDVSINGNSAISTQFFVVGTANLLPGSSIELSDEFSNRINGPGTLVNEGTIRGTGEITVTTLTNRGLIEANSPTGFPLLLTDMTNEGTLRAGGVADLALNRVFNTGGLIEAVDDSVVLFFGPNALVEGGALSTSGNGVIIVPAGLNVQFDDTSGGGGGIEHVALNGDLTMQAGAVLNLDGTFNQNSGTLTMEGESILSVNDTFNQASDVLIQGNSAISTQYFVAGTANLLPGSSIEMSDEFSNRINGPGTLVNEGTIRGTGEITVATLTNRGLIEANSPTGFPLLLTDMNNEGTLRAGGVADLALNRVVNTASGLIEAVDDSVVLFFGPNARIAGGTLSTSGNGTMIIPTGLNVEFDDNPGGGGGIAHVAMNGSLIMEAESILNIFGTYNQMGDVAINGNSATSTQFFVVGTANLLPGSSIEMSDEFSNRINGPGTLVNEGTIRGTGEITVTTLTNRGLIEANSPTGFPLLLTDMNNEGTLRAGGVADLALNRVVNSASGLIEAVDDSVVLFFGPNARIAGGTLSTSGNGVMIVPTGLNVEFSDHPGGPGQIVSNADIQISQNGVASIQGTITGTGRWTVNSGTLQVSASADLGTSGAISVSGSGLLEIQTSGKLTGSDFALDAQSSLDIDGTVELSGSFASSINDPANWSWASGSKLEMLGGVGATVNDLSQWASLELAGDDIGTDPNNHVGDLAGFDNSNFYLPHLVVGTDARIKLDDLLDNGNRGGAFGSAEALYVDMLEFSDASGLLHLNGLHLYFNTLIGSPGQIVGGPIPEPCAIVIAMMATLGLFVVRRR